MRYWYKLSDASKLEDMIIAGDDISVIPVYEETAEILKDFETNEFSDWWKVREFPGYVNNRDDFESAEEAQAELYSCLYDDLYCRLHDC